MEERLVRNEEAGGSSPLPSTKTPIKTIVFEERADGVRPGSTSVLLFRVAAGPTAWMTPVYPCLLAVIFKLFGIYSRSSAFV